MLCFPGPFLPAGHTQGKSPLSGTWKISYTSPEAAGQAVSQAWAFSSVAPRFIFCEQMFLDPVGDSDSSCQTVIQRKEVPAPTSQWPAASYLNCGSCAISA